MKIITCITICFYMFGCASYIPLEDFKYRPEDKSDYCSGTKRIFLIPTESMSTEDYSEFTENIAWIVTALEYKKCFKAISVIKNIESVNDLTPSDTVLAVSYRKSPTSKGILKTINQTAFLLSVGIIPLYARTDYKIQAANKESLNYSRTSLGSIFLLFHSGGSGAVTLKSIGDESNLIISYLQN